jgi:Gas vesicle protein
VSPRGGAIRKLLEEGDSTVLDLVDHVLNKGVVIEGDVVLGLAGVDLVYLRLSAVLAAADRVLGDSAARAPRRPAP